MPGEIRAKKVIDIDGDTGNDDDQSPGEGWTFELFYQNGEWHTLGTKVTGADGYTDYWENLLLGNYMMVEVSAPSSGYSSHDPKYISLTTADQEITMTFYNQPLGSLQICKVIDPDMVADSGDEYPGGAGWVFEVYLDSNLVDTLTTDGTGCTEILGNLVYGTYWVYETDGPEGVWAEAGPWSVLINSNTAVTQLEASNTPLGSIQICKMIDYDNDGVGDETGGAGWEFELYMWDSELGDGGDWALIGTYETLECGCTIVIGNLLFGDYMVVEVPMTGYAPVDEQYVTIDEAGEFAEFTFLNVPLGKICVFKYEDLNLDGRYQEGEPVVSGVFIEIFDSGMGLVASGYTDAEGRFCQNDLLFGTYYVQETVPTGWATMDDTLKEVVIESGECVTVTFLNAEKIDLSACKYEDVNGNGIVDEGDIPVENWRIDLFVWNDCWVLVDSKLTGPCGCVVFEDLDPYCDYMISEEGMLEENEGWIPATGWDTEVVFIHGVDFMSGDSYYGKGVVYGILRDTGDVYEIDILAGTSILVFEMPNPPGANSASPNGLAYDAENGRVYYTDYQLGTNPDKLYFWDGVMQHLAGQIAQGTVACADFSDGKYYYIPSGTDDLRAISFNPDGTILSDVKIADISGNAHSWTFNGDIAVRNGMLYGWGLCAVSGHGYEFFTYDLVTPAFSYIKPVYQSSLQLAFGSDDILYGHRAGTLGEFYAIDTATAAVTKVMPTPIPPNQYTDTASGVDVTRVTFLNFELVNITAEKLKDLTGDGPSEDDTPIEGWEVYLYQKIGEEWVIIDTQYTGADGTFTWFLGPGEYKVGENEIVGWLPMTDTEHEFGPVTSGGEYSFAFHNFEVLPCINITKSVEWDIEEYLSHTQGYWKNHLCAWVGIDSCAIFAIGGTAAVDFDAFPGGLTYIQVFKTSPKGDASIILAHQYLAAKLNDLKWGAPDVYDGFIVDAEEFLLAHPVGSDPQGEDREYAIMLAEVLTDYNEGNHSGTVYPGLTLIYTVNVTNCGNVPLYNVHVYDSLLNTTFWLEDCGDYDGILDVGEWWEIVYTYEIPYEGDDCYGPFQWTWSYGDHHGCMGEGDWEWSWSYMHCNCEPEVPNMLCNTATAYGQAGLPEWNMWVQDSATVCLELWYYAATQGYWKNHPCAWVGISPGDEFFDSGMSWMELFWTPPAGDMIIVLAHQYMASMLNDEMWGAPARYVDVIQDATDFLSEHSIGEDLTDEEKEMAHELAEALAEYNEGGVHP